MNESYGILAGFTDEENFLNALRRLKKAGYSEFEIFTPYFVEETEELLPHRRSPVPGVMLAAGIVGGTTALGLQIWAALDYPFNVGGRPLLSWPAYIPVIFELTVLTAALSGVATFFCLAHFPRLHHPVFTSAAFKRASQDRFFLCLRLSPRAPDAEQARSLLSSFRADSVEEIFS